ncbi:MAG: hypothetical protein JO306_10945 [Gemmatimonadetes bacterium]|nr:hypothetical protein [Gemmatimonadota bacterium]
MQIEFIRNEELSHPDCNLVIDGQLVDRASAYVTESFKKRGTFRVSFHDESLSTRIAEAPPADLPAAMQEYVLRYRLADIDAEQSVVVDRTKAELLLLLSYETKNWKKFWSFNEYFETLRQAAEAAGFKLESTHKGAIKQSNMAFVLPLAESRPLAAQLADVARELPGLHRAAEEALGTSIEKDVLLALFEFPDEVKTICEQYLLFFVEFLKTLGVEVIAGLQEDAGRVLFSVVPRSGTDALYKLRQALDLYLELPSTPRVEVMTYDYGDSRIQALVATAQHFRSQLMLANAALQMKEATIERQRAHIQEYHAITTRVMVESLRATNLDSEAKEEVLAGTVALGNHSFWGVELHWGELFRRLKAWLGPVKRSAPAHLPDGGTSAAAAAANERQQNET